MSLSREDMLRELELLPVWRTRLPTAASVPAVTLAEPVTPLVAAEVVEVVTEPVIEATPAVLNIDAPVFANLQPEPPEPLPEVAESALPEVVAEPLVQAPWLLYCPQASDMQSEQLLQNIMRALQLPLEDVSLYQQPLHLAQIKTRCCVLFGLEHANAFLAANYAEMAAVRGQILTYGDVMVVVTHHPQAMLQNPLLKREVWQDICLLLAKNAHLAT